MEEEERSPELVLAEGRPGPLLPDAWCPRQLRSRGGGAPPPDFKKIFRIPLLRRKEKNLEISHCIF